VAVSAPNESDGRGDVPAERQSVLGNLPSTRPQRSSARRAAARGSTTAKPPAAATPAAAAKPAAGAKRARSGAGSARSSGAKASSAARSSRPKAAKAAAGKQRKAQTASRRAVPKARQSVPRQGFESEADRARGEVHPPGGTELIASAVEIVGDLAKSGLATGERVIKDVFSRLTP
jgi:hypothetical protein